MDTEMNCEETAMAKEVLSKPETPEESPEPEKSPAAKGESEQMAANGHNAELVNSPQTEEAIVTESVTLTEEEADMEVEASSPPEPAPEAVAAVPETDESSEKSPELVADAEPEPVMEAESVPVAQLQELTLEDQVTAPERAEAEPPSLGEKEPQQVETEEVPVEAETKEISEEKVEEKPVAAELAAEKEAKSTESATPKEDEAKPKVVELVSPEKPTEPVGVKEEEPSAEAAAAAPVADKKEAEAPAVAAEAPAVSAEAPAVAAEVPKEEDTAPASGSLSFTILEQTQTKDALLTSRTLVVLQGLPGSGKSFLARTIADTYKDHCTVICADEHGVKPESPEASADGYKAVDEAVVSRCSAGTASSSLLLVVDDTNHTQDRLARLAELAEQHHLVAIFLEPRTEWCRDVEQLGKKSKRGLQEAQLKTMKGQLEEMSLPLYFGWFLLSSVQEKVRCTAMDFLKTLDTLEAFKKHMADFPGKPETEVDLEQYFKPKNMLHCTAKFCDYGKAEGCKEYAQREAVKDNYGLVYELSLTALFVTPRTVGARVSLTEEQLLLWPDDAEKEAPSGASLPLGSRAHVTLGCAEGVEPVQTGFDLLDILALQQASEKGELVVEMELGELVYFSEGRWLLSLREPMGVPACFSSFYGRKEQEPVKKETEKKKKPKCTIL